MHIAFEQLGLNKDNDDETNRSKNTVNIRKIQLNTNFFLDFNKDAEEELFLNKFEIIEDLYEYYKYMITIKQMDDLKNTWTPNSESRQKVWMNK
jgi:hypothetical protein